jgi:hypothetical protein
MNVVETQEAIAAASAAFPKWSGLSAKVDRFHSIGIVTPNKVYRNSNDMIFSSGSTNSCENTTKTSVASSYVSA